MHLLINGLSIGSGGGLTVGRSLLVHLAQARPEWIVTVALIDGSELHQEIAANGLPANCRLHWAPAATRRRFARARYENRDLVRFADDRHVSAVLQLNGMIVSRLRRPTLCHNQDPMPYRPEAWGGWRDRVLAALKRREQKRGLRRADFVGWTSHYLRNLMISWLKVQPGYEEVFYNGVPQPWLDRARRGVPPLSHRPLEIVTVSDVSAHKRQSLVIDALPEIIARTGCKELRYRIVGRSVPEDYVQSLRDRARARAVERNVVFEGRVSDERVQQALADARCFVLMSVCESFGIPAIEAMTFGTPVVTADCAAMPEVCHDAAELCPPDDVAALAARISLVLLDSRRAEILQRSGVEQAQRFSWTSIASRMAARLEEMVERSKL